VLVENVGRVVSKDDLIKLVWKECCVEEGNLDVSVFKLRQGLGQRQGDHSYIETVPRRGYRSMANVRPEHQNESELGGLDFPMRPTARAPEAAMIGRLN